MFFALGIAGLALIGFAHRTYIFSEDSYMLAYKQKHARIAALESPKLVLVGGSANAFGWDSKRVEAETDLRVVNMAYYAGQGIDYRLNEVEGYLKSGDVVVLSIEYQILHGHMNASLPFLAAYTDWRSFNHFGKRNWRRFFDHGALVGLRGVLRESVAALGANYPEFAHPYRLDSFNEFGDVVAHLEMPAKDRERFSEDIIEEDWEALDYSVKQMNRFATACREKGAEVFVWLPALPDGVFQASFSDLRRTVDVLKKGLNLRLLNDFPDIETEDRLFFDSYYHLHGEGRLEHTDRLIKALKAMGVESRRRPAVL